MIEAIGCAAYYSRSRLKPLAFKRGVVGADENEIVAEQAA